MSTYMPQGGQVKIREAMAPFNLVIEKNLVSLLGTVSLKW